MVVTLLTGVVLFAGETISELAYLPLYAFLATAFVWQRLRRPGRKRL